MLLVLLALGVIGSALFTMMVIVFMLIVLAKESYSPELTVMGSLVVVVFGSWLSAHPFLEPHHAFSGFGAPAVITIAALFVVARAVRKTGVFNLVANWAMGQQSNSNQAIFRMASPLIGLSAFFNNTPVVSIFLPIVRDWSIQRGISPSKVLIPLSYLTAFGGLCTLVGSSTHLMINGMAAKESVYEMNMFDLAWVGLPMALVGVIYLWVFSDKLLPDRKDLLDDASSSVKNFLFEMSIKEGASIIGKNIVEAGLRNLDACFLFEVKRGDQLIGPVKGTHVLKAGDILVFSGSSDAAFKLHYHNDLEIVQEDCDLKISKYSRLLEVMISPTSSLIGKSLNEVYFNRTYNASVLALHRHGKQLSGGIGELPLEVGDTLLILADVGFRKIWQDSSEFMMVSPIRQDLEQNSKLPLSLLISVLMIGLPAFQVVPILYTSILAAFLLVWTRILDSKEVLPAIEWSVLITIGASIGLGRALSGSGASQSISEVIVSLSAFAGPMGTLLLLYVLTNMLTEMITNAAAAALSFPLALSCAATLGVSSTPFIIAIAIAASASFATPIGYQTNMLVYGPGGYRFKDFIKIGLPINVMYAIGSMLIIPWVWPF